MSRKYAFNLLDPDQDASAPINVNDGITNIANTSMRVTAASGLGTGATVSITGGLAGGRIQLNSGTSATTGLMATVTHPAITGLTSGGLVICSASLHAAQTETDTGGGNGRWWCDQPNNTSFRIFNTANPVGDSKNFVLNYVFVQNKS